MNNLRKMEMHEAILSPFQIMKNTHETETVDIHEIKMRSYEVEMRILHLMTYKEAKHAN